MHQQPATGMEMPGFVGVEAMPVGALTCSQQKQDGRAGLPGAAGRWHRVAGPVGFAEVAALRMRGELQLLDQAHAVIS
jgi:hypothetical protein